MSDPADTGYTCCGPMEPINLPAMSLLGPAAYLCPNPDCKRWRHALPRNETQLRALVETAMARLIAAGVLCLLFALPAHAESLKWPSAAFLAAQAADRSSPRTKPLSNVFAIRRSEQGSFNCPSATDARCDNSATKTGLSVPFRFSQSAAIECDQSAGAPIIGLYFGCRPSAITRLVIAVIVDPVDRASCWTPAHVFNKGGQVIFPSITDRDTTPTIGWILYGIRLQASVSHRYPCPEFPAISVVPGFAVSKPEFADSFRVDASATLLPTFQGPNSNQQGISTIAFTQQAPMLTGEVFRSNGQSNQFTETLTDPMRSRHSHSENVAHTRPSIMVPGIAFVGTQILDLATTHAALASGRGVEANSLMQGSDAKRIALKAATSAGVLGLAHLVGKDHPKAAKVLLYSLSGATFAVAARNARVGR